MRKGFAAAAAVLLALGMTTTAFAGQWVPVGRNWWYDNGDGTWPSDTWKWIDGNGDGIAECYYFDSDGICLLNTDSPDGYQVNESGAWTVYGVVQTRTVETAEGAEQGQEVEPAAGAEQISEELSASGAEQALTEEGSGN